MTIKLRTAKKTRPLRVIVRYVTWFSAAIAPLQATYEFINKTNLPWVGTQLKPRLLDILGAVCEMAGGITVGIPIFALACVVLLGTVLFMPLYAICNKFFPEIDTEDWIGWFLGACIALPTLFYLYLIVDTVLHPRELMSISYSKAEPEWGIWWWACAALGALVLFYGYATIFNQIKEIIRENADE